MNTSKLLLGMMVFTTLIAATASAQSRRSSDRYVSPNEQFSLEGALDMFKRSSTPEVFEQMLNSPDNDVNNLDLDRNGVTDYIRVVESMEGEDHVFVLQVPFSQDDAQDIAVIELERTGRESAMIQIVGDEELFGTDNIAEPYEEERQHNYYRPQAGNGYGPDAYFPEFAPDRIVVNVWSWPIVVRVYAPHYRPWVSPWGWNRRPVWYRPWRPVPVQVFYPRRSHYRPQYVIVHQHRTVRSHRYYTPMRTRSARVTTYHGHNGHKVRVVRTPGRRRG